MESANPALSSIMISLHEIDPINRTNKHPGSSRFPGAFLVWFPAVGLPNTNRSGYGPAEDPASPAVQYSKVIFLCGRLFGVSNGKFHSFICRTIGLKSPNSSPSSYAKSPLTLPS